MSAHAASAILEVEDAPVQPNIEPMARPSVRKEGLGKSKNEKQVSARIRERTHAAAL